MLNKIAKNIDGLNEKLGKATSWLTLILALVVSYDVVIRYIFDESSVALQELEWHLFAIIFLLAAAFTLKIDEHGRVDVFYTNFSESKKAWVNLMGSLLFLVPLCIVVIISSENFVLTSFKVKEISPDAGGLPARYIIKAMIPVSFFFLFLQSISVVIKSIGTIKKIHNQTGPSG